MSRERRLNGNDRCENGHSYPSSTAVANPLLPVAPERAAVVAWLRLAPYRPRLPEVIAMMQAMPGTDRELQPVTGHTLIWTQQKLSALLRRGVITRRHDVYRVVSDYQPSSTLRILGAMQAGPMTCKDVAALGVSPKSAIGILADLERRGRIEVDPVARPLRYSLVKGLERMAEYEDARQGL